MIQEKKEKGKIYLVKGMCNNCYGSLVNYSITFGLKADKELEKILCLSCGVKGAVKSSR